jgi:RNase P/RNase MRP subunit p29
MRWPDIFFKAKLTKRENDPAEPKGDQVTDAGTADAPGRPAVNQINLPPAPVHPVTSDTSVVKEMAEADTLRELTRSGGIRLVKRDFSPVPEKSDSSTANPALKTPPAPPSSTPPPLGEKKPDAVPPRTAPAINLSGARNPNAAVYPSAMPIFRRRTKIADVARIVLPPRREEASSAAPPEPLPVSAPASPPDSSGTVIPASFPVAIPTGSVLKTEADRTETEPPEIPRPENDSIPETENVPAPAPELEKEVGLEEKPEPMPESSEDPKSEAPPASAESPSTALATDSAPPAKDKREFVLSNGERILGHILSETPESIYINHDTLGVLTIPRAQIAQRPVEIILINGDRIVGDIVAETSDSLFVRHASLGILTVPRSQRSTRVVEAILKDGDRILGEVLGETENFTVIRSATLGTVAVPHNRVALLNRRAEEVQMKALPPALENKPAS